MKYLKAFISGIALPSTILPIFLCFAAMMGAKHILNLASFHMVPLIWGVWNVLYISIFYKHLPNDVNARYFITGAVLGFLLALFGVFELNLPKAMDIPKHWHYLPLIVAPIVYAILWRFIVKPLNDVLDVKEG